MPQEASWNEWNTVGPESFGFVLHFGIRTYVQFMRQANPLEAFNVRNVVALAWVRIYRDDPTGFEG